MKSSVDTQIPKTPIVRGYSGQSIGEKAELSIVASRRMPWKTPPRSQAEKVYWQSLYIQEPAHPASFSRIEKELETQAGSQSVPLFDGPAQLRNREFSVHQAVWLSISETAKSIGENGWKAWIAGGTVAAITWVIGGFTALIISAIALAGANSIISVFGDIKQGQFSATRTLADLAQFPVFMSLIAIGRFADYGIGDDPIIIVRSLMASIVITICFWRSFRGLVRLADLEGLDDLIEQELDLLIDWINQRRSRHR
jgi:hypothetical protein